ncbi:extracellular solute-binding protein [Streptomyces sp. NPDC002889]|uniref:extracellular solute-binding protein n=1 Tax=Streptomyces sp. NPDC002889 TaxID=3364669 RepID=UPI003679DE6B
MRLHSGSCTLALLILLAGCSTGYDDPVPVPPDKRIVFATGTDLTDSEVRRDLIDRWADKNDVDVDVVQLHETADLQRSQMIGALQSGTARYDVVNLDVTWTAEFAADGLIQPWPDPLDDDFLDEAEATVTHDKQVWGVPFNTDAGLLYYNKDKLREDRSWKTWEGLTKAVQEKQVFHATQLKDYEGLTVNVLEAALGKGQGNWGESRTPDADALRGAVNGMVQGLHGPRKYIFGSSTVYTERESALAFQEGKVQVMRNWPYAFRALTRHMPNWQNDLGVTQLPGYSAEDEGAPRTILGGQNLAVARSSKNPDLARNLINYLTSKESERCLMAVGFAATRESAYQGDPPRCPDGIAEEAFIQREGQPIPDGKQLNEFRAEVREAVKHAMQRPTTPYYASYTQTMQTAVHRALQSGRALSEVEAQQLYTCLIRAHEGQKYQSEDRSSLRCS